MLLLAYLDALAREHAHHTRTQPMVLLAESCPYRLMHYWSSYVRRHMKELLSSCKIKPDVAELEIHPFNQQPELVALCRANGIQVGTGRPGGEGGGFPGEVG